MHRVPVSHRQLGPVQPRCDANVAMFLTVSFKRMVKEPITLSDGLVLPKDTYICVVNTSSIGREEEPFDGYRYTRKRDQGNAGATLPRNQYSSTDKDHITFGHGRFACPGRFVASVEIKLVLAAMLERYDLAFDQEGQSSTRPPNLHVLELGFQDPRVKVYVREREGR